MVSQTITVCWERYKAFCFSANQKSTRTCSFNCCNAFSILSYFAHLKVMNLILFLLAFLNVLNNMDWTITYFLLIPSTEPRTKARSELPNVPPRISPCQDLCSSTCIDCLQLFWSTSTLPSTIRDLTPSGRTHWLGSLVASIMPVYMLLFVVSVGVWLAQSLSSPSRRIDSVAPK